MKKPVFEFRTPDDRYWSFNYQFSVVEGNNWTGYASNSLRNLKRRAKELRLSFVEISTSSGQLTYGQRFVDELFYKPRYNR